MTCICDILKYSIFENVFKCNVITRRTCFEKSEVLNHFINDISKSNNNLCSRKTGWMLVDLIDTKQRQIFFNLFVFDICKSSHNKFQFDSK